jgi:hypothetical protein
VTDTVWKYRIPPGARFPVEMPEGAQIVHVDMQGDTPQMWAVVDPALPTEERWFRLVGTGHEIPECSGRRKHVGSFLTRGGAFVFHLFELVVIE